MPGCRAHCCCIGARSLAAQERPEAGRIGEQAPCRRRLLSQTQWLPASVHAALRTMSGCSGSRASQVGRQGPLQALLPLGRCVHGAVLGAGPGRWSWALKLLLLAMLVLCMHTPAMDGPLIGMSFLLSQRRLLPPPPTSRHPHRRLERGGGALLGGSHQDCLHDRGPHGAAQGGVDHHQGRPGAAVHVCLFCSPCVAAACCPAVGGRRPALRHPAPQLALSATCCGSGAAADCCPACR